MFDVGFWEIGLIFVVLLIVVGPERLPGLARKAGLWIGKARQMVAEVKSEVDRELQIEDIKRSINQQTNLDELRKLARDMKSIESDIETALDHKPRNESNATRNSKAAPSLEKKPSDQYGSTDQAQTINKPSDASSGANPPIKRDNGV